jgi:hypothetical protein
MRQRGRPSSSARLTAAKPTRPIPAMAVAVRILVVLRFMIGYSMFALPWISGI